MPVKPRHNQRAEYIKEYVNKSQSTTNAVRELAEKLFLGESTVWKDFKK